MEQLLSPWDPAALGHAPEATRLVTDIPLLTADEAAHVRADVHACRALWRSRDRTYPFFTLGAASYLDAREAQFTAYEALARHSNRVLLERFGWVLERLRLAVGRAVGGDTAYETGLALPGFHIYLFHPGYRASGAGRHYDLQHELIDWTSIGTPDPTSQLSFTLSIALPACGAGLLVWNIHHRALDAMTREERIAHCAANRVATRHPYTVGHAAVHSGYWLHQLVAGSNVRPGDERITLQAHMLRVDSRWTIYW